MENITIRKKAKGKSANTSLSSLNISFTSTHSDYLSNSLPDLSTRFGLYDEIENLKAEIEHLKIKLQSANAEIDNLNTENLSLIQKTLDQDNIILKLKQICSHAESSKKNRSVKKVYSKKFIKQDKENLNISCTELGLQSENPLENPIEICATQDISPTIKSSLVNKTQDKNETLQKPLNKNPLITIIGGQQCVGLAAQLKKFRRNTMYENYRIQATTKPNATTEEILKSCDTIEDNAGNFIIISVGENDKNPYDIITSLVLTLKSVISSNVILLNVIKNKYLNEFMINNILKNISNKFKNCTFLNIPLSTKLSQKNYLNNLCNRINLTIDTFFYYTKYLGFYKNKKIVVNKKQISSVSMPKKGTIPYYFTVLKDKNVSQTTQDTFFR